MSKQQKKTGSVAFGGMAARSLGDNIGSEQWLEAKNKKETAKKYAQDLVNFNKMIQKRKQAKKLEISDSISVNEKAVLSKNNMLSQSDFGIDKVDFDKNSNLSFASGAFSNNLKEKVKTIKEK